MKALPQNSIPLYYTLPGRACAYQQIDPKSNHLERAKRIFEKDHRIELRRLETFFLGNGRPQLVIRTAPESDYYVLVAEASINETRALHYKWCEEFMRSYKPGLPGELQRQSESKAAALREQIYAELRKRARGRLTLAASEPIGRSRALVPLSSLWPHGRPP